MSARCCPTGTGACSVANPASLCNGTSDLQNFNPQTAWPDASSCVQNVQVERRASRRPASISRARSCSPSTRHPGRQLLLPARCASGERGRRRDVEAAQQQDVAVAASRRWCKAPSAGPISRRGGRSPSIGYVYILPYCAQGGTCGLHVAFHGCKQGGETDLPFGKIYAKYAGYNEWAKLNVIVVLYPQIQDTTFGAVILVGCCDWWLTDELRHQSYRDRAVAR